MTCSFSLAKCTRLKYLVLMTKRIISVMAILQEKSMLVWIVLKLSMFYVSSKECSLLFQWSSINELDKLPSLRSLQCHNNPFMDTEKNRETLRQLIIAKISQLEVLNKSEVRGISTNSVSSGKKMKSLPEELFSVSFKITVCLGAGRVPPKTLSSRSHWGTRYGHKIQPC